jgi:hypothetical protein
VRSSLTTGKTVPLGWIDRSPSSESIAWISWAQNAIQNNLLLLAEALMSFKVGINN